MKNILVVTGGAGFVGSNLISYLIKKTNHKIISIDNYSSGSKKNHIKNPRVKYFSSHTKNISQILKKPKNINEDAGNPLETSAVRAAQGPGIQITSILFSRTF